MKPEPILDVRGISKRYRSPDGVTVTVLDDLCFQQYPGELLAIVGPSGCGKTTLLRLIAGLLQPDAGETWCFGDRVDGPSGRTDIVFQDYSRSLFPWLNVWKNITFGLRRGARRAIVDQVQAAIDTVGLRGFERYYPWQLSGGMQQRVALARALVADARLLLLDEPFGSIDAQTRQELQEFVLGLCLDLPVPMLLVTHDINEALFMADRVLVLSQCPSRILADLVVDLPRARSFVDRQDSPQFIPLRKHVEQLLRGARARDSEVSSPLEAGR